MHQQSHQETIHWREWGEAAFRCAEQEGKPVLLTLTATWCHWCHVLDQTSYAEARVIHLVNSRFIPVRVDVDRRPDLSARYNQGGFPSVAILNDHGMLLDGCVYVPPDEMVQWLEEASRQYAQRQRTGIPHSLRVTTSIPAADAGETPAESVLRRLQETYDRSYGGFGLEPKQPPWEALKFLLALYSRSGDRAVLQMVCTTLDNMRVGIYDQKEQGFFRYSVSRDWHVPHYEKMLATNANLASVYLDAYQITGRRRYRATAIGMLTYLLETLYDRSQGLFYASQDAAETYYRLPWKDREQAEKPRLDRTFYTGLNALAAAVLGKAYGVLGRSRYLAIASSILDHLWQQGWESEWGLRHVLGDASLQLRLFADHVYTARALLDLYQVSGQTAQLSRASECVRGIETFFGAAEGGFYDVEQSAEGLDAWLVQEQPVLENALFAEVLMILSCLTGDAHYLPTARRTLETFQGCVPGHSYLGPIGSRRVEEDEEQLFLPAGSAWGRAWDMAVHGPVHLVLVGRSTHPRTSGLFRAARRVYTPHRVLQFLDPVQDAERIAALGFPPGPEPVLYVCLGGMCLAPITTLDGICTLRTARPWTAVRI
jgi:uncharacterized protein YyaL (SSP411 family)